MSFDVRRHLISLKGKDYLPVAARLIWLREEHPDWGIVTTALEINLAPEGNRSPYAIFQAQIFNAEGRLMATGTKMEDARGFPDHVEKAETGSVGRALAMCGYGTQFAPELHDGMKGEESHQEPRHDQPRTQPRTEPASGSRQSVPVTAAPTPPEPVRTPGEPASPYTPQELAELNEAGKAFTVGADNLGLDVRGADGGTDKAKVKALLAAVLTFGGIELPELYYARHYATAKRHLADYRNWFKAQEQKAALTASTVTPNPTGYDPGEKSFSPETLAGMGPPPVTNANPLLGGL